MHVVAHFRQHDEDRATAARDRRCTRRDYGTWRCSGRITLYALRCGGLYCQNHLRVYQPDVYAETQNRIHVRRALEAMADLRERAQMAPLDDPARVRSRAGMERLLSLVFDKPTKAHWAYPPQAVARAQYARAWP